MHDRHKLRIVKVCKESRLAGDSGVGEENIEALVFGHGIVDDSLDLFFVTGVKLPGMHLDGRISLVDFLLVRFEVRRIVVANVNGLCAALGILVRGGSANAQRRVGAFAESAFRLTRGWFLCIALPYP